jgi:hypothetical protein
MSTTPTTPIRERSQEQLAVGSALAKLWKAALAVPVEERADLNGLLTAYTVDRAEFWATVDRDLESAAEAEAEAERDAETGAQS